MPSGKVHDRIALISVLPLFLTGMIIFLPNLIKIFLFTLASFFCQIMFGPDLDLQSTQYKRWGIFRWIWIPYRKIFKHRSRFSHGLLFGPIIRCVYLALAGFTVLIVLNYMIYQLLGLNILLKSIPLTAGLVIKLNFIKVYYYLIPVISGLFIGAAIHTFTDKIDSFFKNIV